MHIEVTNLNINLIESDVQRLFTPFGEISSITLLRDKLNNRSTGRAIVNMPVEQEAQKALAALTGSQLANKTITVIKVPYTEEERFPKSIY